jgi:hypothetical protein
MAVVYQDGGDAINLYGDEADAAPCVPKHCPSAPEYAM